MTDLLEARQLTRRYGDFTAVRDVDVTLHRGEILGFLGPNGAGKSTCLRMITGNLAPHDGRVSVRGVDLWRDPVRAKSALGYLPEIPPLYPDQRVDEFLDYAARLHRVPRVDLAAAVGHARRLCGLEGVGRKLIRKLSKGYRQRVGIAQAIVHRPELIVLDEPMVGLDPAQSGEVRDMIRDLGADRGVLLSSHLLAEVQSLCTRALILHQGTVVHSAALDGAHGEGPVRSLLVRLERPPESARLAAAAQVASVEALGEGRFRLTLRDGETSAGLARYAVENGWGLAELTPERAGLEQIFLEVTAGAAR